MEDTLRTKVAASVTVSYSSPLHMLSPATVALANSLRQLLAPLCMAPFCLISLDLSLRVSPRFKGCCAYQGLAKLYRKEWRYIDFRLSALSGWPSCGLLAEDLELSIHISKMGTKRQGLCEMSAQGLQGTMLNPGPFSQGFGPPGLFLEVVIALEAKIQIVSPYLLSALTPSPQRWGGREASRSSIPIQAERLQTESCDPG